MAEKWWRDILAQFTKLDQYTLQEILFCRPDYHRQYFNTIQIIIVHTSTQFKKDKPNPGLICQSHNNIVIDCGAYMQNGRVAALRLDDMKEFYAEKDSGL